MASNKYASNGITEELIRTFIQLGCAELHTKTLIEKYEAELDEGLIDIDDEDVVMEQNNKIERLGNRLENYTNARRDVMRYIQKLHPNGNEDLWCLVKHLGMAMFTLFESYQASEQDIELYDLWLETNKMFIDIMSEFLGVEITECASCFNDMLKGKK